MRKAQRLVDLEDIISSNLYGPEKGSLIDPIIRGHLMLEALIVELIHSVNSDEDVWKWPFPKKTKYLVTNGSIPKDIKFAFDSINNLRNDFAHSFGHSVNPEYLLKLAKDLENNGIDFSDSMGYYQVSEALEFFGGIEGILSEILWCVLFEAASILHGDKVRNMF